MARAGRPTDSRCKVAKESARLHVQRHEAKVEVLERDPELPVGDYGALPVLLQLRLDVAGLALR